MSSLTDYIQWYADLSFVEKPFSDVDNLILSTLTYYHYDLKGSDRPHSLRRCVTDSTANDGFLRAACSSRRFGSLMISDYEEKFNSDTNLQFAAMKFRLYDNLYYIAFRGTDNSLVGWKEDFVMSYRITEGQTLSVRYLERVIEEDKVYLVGGHSKGGNLALYGACHISDEKRSRIKHIYNNDGPGLCPEVSDVTLVDKVKDRTTVILPQFCVFGKIFAHDIPDTRIVTSSYEGIDQHDLISWGVDHGKLELAADFDPGSLWINDIGDKWLSDVDPAEREALVNSIFAVPESRGIRTYTDAMKLDVDGVEDLVKNVVESDSLKTVAKIPEKAFFGEFVERLKTGKLSKFINANQLVEGIVFTVVGILTAIFSEKAFHVIVTILLGALSVFQLIYIVKKLHESRWNFVREKTRVYLFAVIATLFAIILVKKEAMFIIGSGLAGGWLLIVAYRSFLSFKQRKKRDAAYWKNLIKSVVYTGGGLFIILAPPEMTQWFMLALGILMAIDGISAIVYSFIAANDRYSEKHNKSKEKVRSEK